MLGKRILLLSLVPLIIALSQNVIAGESSHADPWISLEKGILQLYEAHLPDASLLNSPSFGIKFTSYLEAGLWSSAERLLESSTHEDVDLLRLKLYHTQGRFDLIFDLTQRIPDLLVDQPEWLMAASRGALGQHRYTETLDLLNRLVPYEAFTAQRLYLSALAYWGLREGTEFAKVLNEAVAWTKLNVDSPWSDRITLLKIYYHLGNNEFDQAFMSLGEVFDDNADLALLALGWGYFKMNATSNLYSILEGFKLSQPESPYYNQAFRILSRFLIDQGDLQGAIALDQQERIDLSLRVESLENETALIRKGIVPSSSVHPPGALLRETLLSLQKKVGRKKELTALLWYVDLQQRKQSLAQFKKMEHALQEKQRRLQMEIMRRCISLFKTRSTNKAVERLYRQALLAARDGDQHGVSQSLRNILKLEPLGPYADESAFRLGDIAFNNKNYPEAVSYYQRFLNRPESPLTRLALYKLAWSHYLHGEKKETISLLLERSLESDEHREKGDAQCKVIETPQEKREPFRLLALVLQEDQGPAQLFNFVEEKSPEEIFPLYSGLAGFYQSERNHKDLKHLVSSWMESYPLFVETPFLQQKVVVSTIQDSKSSLNDIIEARADFVNRYRPGKAWNLANGPDDSDRIKPILKSHLQFLMTYYYGRGKADREIVMTKKAATWYRIFLEAFPHDEDIGAKRFLFAELLSDLNSNWEAMEAYRTSAYQDPSHPMASEAAHREINLLEGLVPAFDPALQERYAHYIHQFPNDYRVPEILLKKAEAAFHEGGYEKSRAFAKKVLSRKKGRGCRERPSTACLETGEPVLRDIDFDAYRLIAQAYLKESSYEEGIRFLNALFSMYTDQERLQPLRPLLSLAYYQQGDTLKQQGNINQAATAYWGAYENGSDSRLGPLALFEAATLWERTSASFRSEVALETFYERYPKSSLYHTVLMRLGTIYQDSDRLEQAAKIFEKASRLRSTREETRLALEKAITAYEELEGWEKVYQLALQEAERAATQDEQGMALRIKAAEALIQLGRKRTAVTILKGLTQQKNDHPQIRERPSIPLARAYFLLAELKMQDFESIQLIAPMDVNLQKKRSLFNVLLHEYGQAAEGPSFSLLLNARHRMGEIFEEFSRSLLESERPANLSVEEQEVYETLLWEKALPYLEKARESYLQTLALGQERGVDNEWIRMSQAQFLSINKKINLTNPVSRGNS